MLNSYDNFGESGNTTDDVFDLLLVDLQSEAIRNADVITLNIGANDLFN